MGKALLIVVRITNPKRERGWMLQTATISKSNAARCGTFRLAFDSESKSHEALALADASG